MESVRFPTEFSRAQKTLNELTYFKASEFRNFIMYIGVIVLKDILVDKYYIHFLTYVTALRLLTQDNISQETIEKANILLSYFVKCFGKLYGPDNMTFNVHAHLHLPNMVAFNGPLHKISAFPFESFFKLFNSFIHGTRSYGQQINENMQISQIVEGQIEQVTNAMIDLQLKNFIFDLNNQRFNCSPVKKALYLSMHERLVFPECDF